MIGLAALAAAVAAMPALSWEGRAKVFAGDRVIVIGVRTSIAADGTVTSNSWPEALGEAKGLRRMVVRADGGETMIGGKTAPMTAGMLAEERAQFAIYRQMQVAAERSAAVRAAGAGSLSVDGPVRSWFRLGDDGPRAAVNWLPVGEGGAPVRQDFRFDGWWRDNGAIFPRRMVLTRDGLPYFELEVTRFEAR